LLLDKFNAPRRRKHLNSGNNSGAGSVAEWNDIDETVLPNLTAEDLKELGVTALGHRRKLLDAIAALRNDTIGHG